MWSNRIIVFAPFLDDYLSFLEGVEYLPVECPSSKHLGRLGLFRNRGSGSSWIDVNRDSPFEFLRQG